MGPPAELGQRLRQLRRERRVSLADVAAATGISASFLSLVEQGKSDITLGRLVALMRFYDVVLTDLVPEVEAGDPHVVRAADQQHVYSPEEHIDIFLLAPGIHRVMRPLLAVYEPGAAMTEEIRNEGEQFVHVVEGAITLSLEGGDPLVLKTGDSAYFDGSRPHRVENPGRRRARAIMVLTADA